MILDDDAYEWHETTSLEDKSHGKRVFVRGKPKDEATRLRLAFTALADSLEGCDDIPDQIRRILG